MQPVQFFAQNLSGAALPNASVAVYLAGTTTLAPLYSDAGVTSIPNPTTADANGMVFFYSGASPVDIQISSGSYTSPLLRGVVVADPADQVVLATAQANAAATSATNAANSASSAASSSTSAANSAAIASAALSAARVYASTAAGISGTSNGQYFLVIQVVLSYTTLELYLNSSGTAVDQGFALLPSQFVIAKLPTFLSKATFLYNFAISDGSGNVGAALDLLGNWVANAVKTRSINLFGGGGISAMYKRVSGYLWALVDSSGNIGAGLDMQYRFKVPQVITSRIDAPMVNANKFAGLNGGNYNNAELYHMVSYGQSNSVGHGAQGPVTTSQAFNSIMFNGGVISQMNESTAAILTPTQVASNETSLVTLVEAVRETPISGAIEFLLQLIATENGITFNQANRLFQFIGSAPGVGGQDISHLSKGFGSGYYESFLNYDITNAASLAAASNKVYKCLAWLWTQGESDSGRSQATYASQFTTLFQNVDSDIRAKTGQPDTVHCISWQLATEQNEILNVSGTYTLPTIAYALKQVADANPNQVHIACPEYQFNFNTGDYLHLDAPSYKWLGAYYAICYKRVIIDGASWRPLQPVDTNPTMRQGNVVMVKFNVPVKPLVFDTSWVTAAPSMGFQLFQSDGTTAITISSVSLAGPDLVKIVAAAAIPAGAILRYGYPGGLSSPLRTGGMRGNLRDSQGNTLTYQVNASNTFRMDNWCLLFQLTL